MADWSLYQRQPSGFQQALQGLQVGAQLAGTVSNISQQQKQAQALEASQQRQAAFNQAFGAAYQTGDKKAITDLIGQFPEQFDQIKQIAGFKDEQQNKAFGSLGLQLKGAIDSGNPQAAAQLIAANADVLRQAGPGYEPEQLLGALQQDPQGLAKRADTFALTALGPDTYYKVMGAREKNQTTMRGQDLTAQTAIRGQDIQQQESAANRQIAGANLGLRQQEVQIKALEAQNKNLDRSLARETNDLRRQELQQKIELNTAKAQQAKIDRQATAEGVANTFAQAKGSADRLLNHPALNQILGPVGRSSIIPTAPGGPSADFEALLETFKAQTFLPQVQSLKGMGALSDAEGKKLADSVGALSLKMSPGAFKAELRRVQQTLDAAQKKALRGIQPARSGASGSFAPQQGIQQENVPMGGGIKFLGFE